MQRERLADDIKRLFQAPTREDPFHDLEELCANLEKSMARIPTSPPWEAVQSSAGKEKRGTGERSQATGPNPEMGLSVGLTHLDMHNHSWRPASPSGWVWISKVSAVKGIGFPARKEEIRRLGHFARRVQRFGEPPPLLHSFAQVAKGGMSRPWKRREKDDWMDEDDLLGGDFYQEQDLRHKLQRGMGAGSGEGGRGENRGYNADYNHERRGDWRERSDQIRRGGRDAQFHQGSNQPKEAQGKNRDAGQVDPKRDPSKGKGPWNEGNPKSKGPVICFRCSQPGHHQLECTNNPICYKCKATGHMAAECGTTQKSKISMFGFGIPGQGFYSMNIPNAKPQADSALGRVTVLQGEATEKKLEKELKNLIDEDWNFKVKKIANGDYVAAFPDVTTTTTTT